VQEHKLAIFPGFYSSYISHAYLHFILNSKLKKSYYQRLVSVSRDCYPLVI